MTDEQIRIAVAEACGWTVANECICNVLRSSDGSPELEPIAPLPDYPNDLNAMHEAEKVLTAEQRAHYANRVASMLDQGWGFKALHATARQRAEALLRTLGKWEDKP